MKRACFTLAVLVGFGVAYAADKPAEQSELVFPLRVNDNHAPSIVECPNGDLIATWYRRSRQAGNDTAVYGARKRASAATWSQEFIAVDTPGFSDGNTAMMLDADQHLWLFWSVLIADTSESALTTFVRSSVYAGDGPPRWEGRGLIYVKPADLSAEYMRLNPLMASAPQRMVRGPSPEAVAGRINDKLFQRLGWRVRCKPTWLAPAPTHPNGKLLLPLYSDTFSISIMMISDDRGRTWRTSRPIIGAGAIQPTVLVRNNGTLVAYMRDNGGSGHIKVTESTDDGESWGTVTMSELVNPGSAIDGVRLANGHFCLIYNDTGRGRSSLAVSISEDEGTTWKYTRHLERQHDGAYQYPCVIQGRDSTIHVLYSYFPADGTPLSSIKHVAFNEAWVTGARDKSAVSTSTTSARP